MFWFILRKAKRAQYLQYYNEESSYPKQICERWTENLEDAIRFSCEEEAKQFLTEMDCEASIKQINLWN